MVRGGAGERLPVSIRTRPPPADPTSITTWTDALDQLKNPKPRDPVPGIFYKAQYCEEILDMSSIEEFEPAEFDEGMFRRVSSTSTGPLWCNARNRTACCFSIKPTSWFSRTSTGNVAQSQRLRSAQSWYQDFTKVTVE
jgi:hypothetical protein